MYKTVMNGLEIKPEENDFFTFSADALLKEMLIFEEKRKGHSTLKCIFKPCEFCQEVFSMRERLFGLVRNFEYFFLYELPVVLRALAWKLTHHKQWLFLQNHKCQITVEERLPRVIFDRYLWCDECKAIRSDYWRWTHGR